MDTSTREVLGSDRAGPFAIRCYLWRHDVAGSIVVLSMLIWILQQIDVRVSVWGSVRTRVRCLLLVICDRRSLTNHFSLEQPRSTLPNIGQPVSHFEAVDLEISLTFPRLFFFVLFVAVTN